MCGRYYVDEEMFRELKQWIRKGQWNSAPLQTEDICPSQNGIVVREENGALEVTRMFWGFPRYDGKGLLINARAESALERRMFQESVLHRRCIIPAGGFYEWSPDKEKYTYTQNDSSMLLMAGCFRVFEEKERFVILTTAANASVQPVHPRMPLLFDKAEAEAWLRDEKMARKLLEKRPGELKSQAEYVQMRLFL